MREDTALADHNRSYPAGPPAVQIDDTDTYQLQAAARELEALVLHEQARHLAEVYAMLAEQYRRDGVQVADAELDAQAESLAQLERGEWFLKDVATRLHPGSELLELARQLDDHGLGVWGEAAGSLVDDCPPSLAYLRWRVEEEQRAELRSHAHLVRREAKLDDLLRRLGLVGRWWRRGRAAELAGRQKGGAPNCGQPAGPAALARRRASGLGRRPGATPAEGYEPGRPAGHAGRPEGGGR
jgi:hypothetical protein